MTGEDLSREALEQLSAQVSRQLRYLNRLVARMERLGWQVDDMMWREGLRARDAMQGLNIAVHYARCSGVGKNRESRPPDSLT